MSRHTLKTDPDVFEAVFTGVKTFEIRKDDRGYKDGDHLLLRETENSGQEMAKGAPLKFTGRLIQAHVMYVLRGPVYGLEEGWVIMSIHVNERLWGK